VDVENCIMKRFAVRAVRHQNDEGIKKNKWADQVEILGSTRLAYKILVRKCERNIPLKNIGVDVRQILKRILKDGDVSEDVNRTQLLNEWNKWRALVHMVMNPQVG
jgi:hypothetical protein